MMNKKYGFSLIEVMLSTVILLILATLIIPNPKSKVKLGKEARLLECLNQTRRGLLHYNNDFANFPKVGETYNYLNALYTAAALDPALDVPDLAPSEWTLCTILENALLEPQIPPNRWEFYPDEGKYRPPYLRGDGRTIADLIWHEGGTNKGFYENPFTQSKYDWEVKLRKGLFGTHTYSPVLDPSLPGPLYVADSQENTVFYLDTNEVFSGWYRINTRVTDGLGNLHFPIDPDPTNNINESIEIMDIRFYPSNRIGLPGEKKWYLGLNGKYYYQW